MEEFVLNSLSNAENNISKVSNDILKMDGMSGNKTRHFYNNLLEYKNARYLEIGTWKGSSLCSAMYNNTSNIVCIDNFKGHENARDEFYENLNKYKGSNTVKFIEKDCWDDDIIPDEYKFNIYLFDGPHNPMDHYNSLKKYYKYLDDKFIFIVDDWNDYGVRVGTLRAIEDLNLNVTFKHEILLTSDNTHTPFYNNKCIGRDSWWNGIGIFVLKK